MVAEQACFICATAAQLAERCTNPVAVSLLLRAASMMAFTLPMRASPRASPVAGSKLASSGYF
jgi:hypothetical protein